MIDILGLIGQTDLKRRDLLHLSLGSCDCAAVALLWLWDSEWHRLCLSLVDTNASDAVDTQPLVGLCEAVTLGSDLPTLASATISVHSNPVIAEWASPNICPCFESFFPVNIGPAKSRTFSGVLQVFTDRPITTTERSVMAETAAGLAVILQRSRTERQLEVVRRLLPPHAALKDIGTYVAVAAKALKEITNADACLVFREMQGGGFRAAAIAADSEVHVNVVASKISRIRWVALERKTVRFRNFADPEERIAVFGDDLHDVHLAKLIERDVLKKRVIRSVLMAPVEFEQHSIAVVLLLNKQSNSHLASTFSLTDREVLSVACRHLAGVLPTFELYGALTRMARSVSPLALQDPVERRQLFDLIMGTIPGVVGVALWRQGVGDQKPALDVLGGSVNIASPLDAMRQPSSITEITPGEQWIFARPVDEHLSDTCLVLQLSRAFLSTYELEVIAFFCKELTSFLQAEIGNERLIEQFVQLRHAVRSGLTGVVGYVHEAITCFDLFRKLKNAPWVLEQARFRKALERADFSATKTQQLLEDSRFLLGKISRASLRIGQHSVSAIVISVMDTLRPYAKERRVEVSFNNQLLTNLDASGLDKGLVEMLIFNVLDNAIKYSHRRRPIRITLEPVKRGWQLTIRNFGLYIRPEDREVIFRPFIRRPTTQKGEERPGTGLGLAVAREIVIAHGGTISCESRLIREPLAETTFTIRLPRVITREVPL